MPNSFIYRARVCSSASGLALNKKDIESYHRSHAHYLAKGGSAKLFAELHGYEEGCSKGVGGSMHLIDLKNNFYGSTAIVSNLYHWCRTSVFFENK